MSNTNLNLVISILIKPSYCTLTIFTTIRIKTLKNILVKPYINYYLTMILIVVEILLSFRCFVRTLLATQIILFYNLLHNLTLHHNKRQNITNYTKIHIYKYPQTDTHPCTYTCNIVVCLSYQIVYL